MSPTRLCVVLFAVAACAPADAEVQDTSSSTSGQGLYAAAFGSLYVRGTHNGWGLTAMRLENDHAWVAEVAFGTSGQERFKFDVRGDWVTNYGDNEPDSTADRNGRDIAGQAGKTFLIHFNDQSAFYWLEEKTYTANVTLKLPVGLSPSALNAAQAQLFKDGQNYGWNLVYADSTSATVPLCCLAKGSSYRLRVEKFVGQRRFGGEVTWTVDGRSEPIALVLTVTEWPTDGFGSVEVVAFADRFENHQLVSTPWSGMDIFAGDWHAGDRRGTTDASGRFTLMLPAGRAQLSAMVMTGSHSVASTSGEVVVVARANVRTELHLAPTTVAIRAHADVGFGQAVYVSGATSYLGEWKTATRLTWDGASRQWTMVQNLPMGVPYKLLVGPWLAAPTVPVTQLRWEQGGDRIVTPPNGSYQSNLEAWPVF